MGIFKDRCVAQNRDRISNHLNEDKQGPKLSPFMTRESKGTALKYGEKQ